MGLRDPHDPRTFTHFAKLNPDGSVAAIVEVADRFDPGLDGHVYVDVTDLKSSGVDLYAIDVDPGVIAAAKEAPIADRATVSEAFRAAVVKARPDGDQIHK